MIKSLKISNFQSHANSELVFTPGVNVIVGASDSGKTAIIRALRWLIWNRPNGEAFRSTWGGDTRVEIQVDDNIIVRGKTKDIPNLYSVNTKVLQAFKTDVPEQVQKYLNVDETNLQQQLDAPFLISSSPGEVASYFNRIAHLDQIDTGLKSIQADIRKVTGEIQSDKDRVEELKENARAYAYLEWAEIELEVLEKDQELLQKKMNAWTKLKDLTKSIGEVEEEIEQASSLLPFEKKVDQILSLHKSRKEKEEEHTALHQICETLSGIDSDLRSLNNVIQFEKEVDKVLTEINRVADLEEKVRSFKVLIRDIKQIDTDLDELERNIEELEQQFHDEMPDQCPLCGTNLNSK